MNVEQLMTMNPSACRPDDTMQEAARIFWEHDCGCAPVIDDESHVVGMITDRDVCMAAYTQGKTLSEMPVAGAMATMVHTCRATDRVADAERVMRAHQVRRLPVVDVEQHLIGILSLNDIAQEAARERGKSRKAVTDDEVAETLSAVCEPRQAALVTAGA